jgi:hydrogenase-4 component B
MCLTLLIAASILTAVSGAWSVLLRRSPARAQALATLTLVAGAALGLVGAVLALTGPAAQASTSWATPGASLSVRVDTLSALFLLPILGLPALCSIYGLRYAPQATLGAKSIRLQIFFGLVAGAMTLVCIASNAIFFLAAWEVMALSGFFLVLTDDERPESQRAAFVYLASAHAANLGLFALFALLGRMAGSLEFAAMARLDSGAPMAGWVFALALFGFGLKAGLVPLHFWLPGAHAAAPSHVSAIMSGVLLKTGMYGLMRVTGFFSTPPLTWGGTLLVAGVVSGILGVAFALAQHDLKRLLAYHSVENMGIIAMGTGLALLGRSRGDPALVVLGFSGALLHVVNHATFKGLLFLGAGAVHHATGTRELDRLGGLARAMPITSALFLVGAAAISGLPPLNGFASEWLVALAAFGSLADRSVSASSLAVLAAPALALIGGLAAACFAKVVGTTFLGHPRSEEAKKGHEAALSMLAPMAVLAAACAVIGLVPAAFVPALCRAAADWSGFSLASLSAPAASAAQAAWHVSLIAAILATVTGGLVVWRRRRLGPVASTVPTWGCGYAAPTSRMQYTGSSFAELLVLRFRWAFFPRTRVVPPTGLFPRHASFDSHVPDTVLDVAILPSLRSATSWADRLRAHFGGRVQSKVLLVLTGVLGLLGWLALR